MSLSKTWREVLPSVRGRIEFDAKLAGQTWFGVGGTADALFRPQDVEDLAELLSQLPADVPMTVIGVASNLLIRDGGIRGLAIRLGANFAGIHCADLQVTAGAAALDMNVAKAAAQAGIAKLEFMAGIPGTIGGGVIMNAGAYGGEFKDVLSSTMILNRQGKTQHLSNAECHFSYRHSGLPKDSIVLAATFTGQNDDPELIQARIRAIQTKRGETQPIREKTGGSTFANPEPAEVEHLPLDRRKAWQLIDGVGGRGYTVGGAQISLQHCNFMINTGKALASDLEKLGEEMRRRVKEKYGVNLRWEIARIGEPA
jgi:UDP-N-acetylmuramate dehydrogenase